MTETTNNKKLIKKRFDGYLPVVIDVETTGVNPMKNGLLEIAAIATLYNDNNELSGSETTFSTHIIPFEGCTIDQAALKVNGIDPYHPFRFPITEQEAISGLFEYVKTALKQSECRRAVLVGHNAHFDLSFINAAIKRCGLSKDNPFHAFTCFDTATLAGLALGKTILAKALKEAKIEFNTKEAHSATYDTAKTTELFCQIINQFDQQIKISP